MSWWWNSRPREPSPNLSANADVKEMQSSIPQTTLPQTPSTKRTLSMEEQAQQDLDELLKAFQEQAENDKDARIKAKETGTSNAPPIPTDISPDTLYPTEISCRSALDYAMFCQSFGGQFVNVYRYGSFRSCSNHWQDFWLCMRTRNWDPKDKARAIQDHYKQKAVRWKTGPSSEDIWDVRTEPVKDAFQDNLEELEATIAAWQKANPNAEDPWLKPSNATFNNPPPSV